VRDIDGQSDLAIFITQASCPLTRIIMGLRLWGGSSKVIWSGSPMNDEALDKAISERGGLPHEF